ncbi:hypothetical protein BH23GEM10_BH23GEM10_10980 [soil metagenome]
MVADASQHRSRGPVEAASLCNSRVGEADPHGPLVNLRLRVYGRRLDSSALTIRASSTRRTLPLPVSGKESKKRTMSGIL